MNRLMSLAPTWVWFVLGVPMYGVYQLWCLLVYGKIDRGGGTSPRCPWWLR